MMKSHNPALGTHAAPALPRVWPGFAAINERLARVADVLYTWGERRRARRELAALDDRLLADIGLGQGQREHECSKPFWKA